MKLGLSRLLPEHSPPKSMVPPLQSPVPMNTPPGASPSVPSSSDAMPQGGLSLMPVLYTPRAMLPIQEHTSHPRQLQLQDSSRGSGRSLWLIVPRCCPILPASLQAPFLRSYMIALALGLGCMRLCSLTSKSILSGILLQFSDIIVLVLEGSTYAPSFGTPLTLVPTLRCVLIDLRLYKSVLIQLQGRDPHS